MVEQWVVYWVAERVDPKAVPMVVQWAASKVARMEQRWVDLMGDSKAVQLVG